MIGYLGWGNMTAILKGTVCDTHVILPDGRNNDQKSVGLVHIMVHMQGSNSP